VGGKEAFSCCVWKGFEESAEEKEVKWINLKNEYGLISAATTLEQTFRQVELDILVVILTLGKHGLRCKNCNSGRPCDRLKRYQGEIERRFKDYEGFFDVVKELMEIGSWYQPSSDEPSIMHEITPVLKKHRCLVKVAIQGEECK
jgi:hypothetical protein